MNQNYTITKKIVNNSELVKTQQLDLIPRREFIGILYLSRLLENKPGKDIFQYIYFRYINKLKDYGLLWNFNYEFDIIDDRLFNVLRLDLLLYIRCITRFYRDLLEKYPAENFLKDYVFPVREYSNTYKLVMIIIGTYLVEKYHNEINEIRKLLDCYRSDLFEMRDYNIPTYNYIATRLFTVNNEKPSSS